MAKWSDERREDPNPCREQDNGLFEITARDGRARLGRLHTAHGVLETPCLLPVINPNIRTIEPREMWDKYGIQAVITNSYVIWKHDFLRDKAQNDGVHALLDFPGTVMTDSGTFQSYIYLRGGLDDLELVITNRIPVTKGKDDQHKEHQSDPEQRQADLECRI